jgi:hypothetical protein
VTARSLSSFSKSLVPELPRTRSGYDVSIRAYMALIDSSAVAIFLDSVSDQFVPPEFVQRTIYNGVMSIKDTQGSTAAEVPCLS